MSFHPTEDCAVKIKPTEKLTKFVKDFIIVAEDTPENIIELKKSFKEDFKDCVLLINDIKWLKEELYKLRVSFDQPVYLYELLEKANVVLPQPKFVPRNPELDARVKKLLLKEKAREYASMTKNVDSARKFYPEDTIAYQMKQINKQLIAVAQFVFSVITGFVFGFLGIELIIGNLDYGIRLLLGVIIALTIALAEMYFLAKKLNEEDTYETSVTETYSKVHQD